jgi:biotin synthase-related radical SAM superfamily protein
VEYYQRDYVLIRLDRILGKVGGKYRIILQMSVVKLFKMYPNVCPSRASFGTRMRNMNILSKNVMRYGHILRSVQVKNEKKVRLGWSFI